METFNEEIWALTASAPDYEVSSLGRVRRAFDGHSTKRGRIKAQRQNNSGYLTVGCMVRRPQHRQKLFYVHRLVADGFLGPRPKPGMVVCHINGNRLDNRPENLRWDTYKGNEADKIRHGTRIQGSCVPISVLTEEKVRQIRQSYADGRANKLQLAREYGVARATIRRIINRETWRHV